MEHQKEHVRMDSRGYKGTYCHTSEGNMTTVQTYRIKFQSLSICQYRSWNIWTDQKVTSRLTKYFYKQIKFLLQLKFHSRRSLENLSAWKDSEDTGRGRRGVVKQHTDDFYGYHDALERIQGHQDQSSSDQRACSIYGRLAMSIDRSSAIRAAVNRKQHRDWVHMRPDWWLLLLLVKVV